jgi:hypothetical protein
MNKIVNKKVLELIRASLESEGGDGDALWLSKYTSLEVLSELIHEFADENDIDWVLEEKGNHLLWGKDQEWVLITDDVDFFKSQPSWIILKIDF